MILLDLRTAIAAGVKAAAPSLREAKPHGGRFTLEELKAIAAQTPAARIACLGIGGPTGEGGRWLYPVGWGVYLITSDQPRMPRDAAALALVETLLQVLPGNCWGMDASIDGAREIRADNLFHRDLDKHGIALWCLSFRHEVEFGRVEPGSLDDFLTAHIDYDLAPADGKVDASDTITLTRE